MTIPVPIVIFALFIMLLTRFQFVSTPPKYNKRFSCTGFDECGQPKDRKDVD